MASIAQAQTSVDTLPLAQIPVLESLARATDLQTLMSLCQTNQRLLEASQSPSIWDEFVQKSKTVYDLEQRAGGVLFDLDAARDEPVQQRGRLLVQLALAAQRAGLFPPESDFASSLLFNLLGYHAAVKQSSDCNRMRRARQFIQVMQSVAPSDRRAYLSDLFKYGGLCLFAEQLYALHNLGFSIHEDFIVDQNVNRETKVLAPALDLAVLRSDGRALAEWIKAARMLGMSDADIRNRVRSTVDAYERQQRMPTEIGFGATFESDPRDFRNEIWPFIMTRQVAGAILNATLAASPLTA